MTLDIIFGLGTLRVPKLDGIKMADMWMTILMGWVHGL